MADNDLRGLIELSINGALYDVANVIHHLFKSDYVSARLKNKLWFKFDGNKWKQIEEGPYYEISTTVIYHYEEFLKEHLIKESELQQALTQEVFDKEKDNLNDQLKGIQTTITDTNKLIEKLKSVNYKELICKECLYLFYDRDFISKLDRKDTYLCFKDYIFDFRTKTKRKGTREDMISIYIDSEYTEADTEEAVQKQEILYNTFNEFRKKRVKNLFPKNIFTLSTF